MAQDACLGYLLGDQKSACRGRPTIVAASDESRAESNRSESGVLADGKSVSLA
jgi:hypothetical protein